MRYLIALLLSVLHLSATMILNLNVKEAPDRVELVLNFDLPYTGALVKKRERDRIDIILKKVTLLAPWQRKLSSKLVYQIDAKPLKSGTLISFYTTSEPRLVAARSKDGYSLKIELRPAAQGEKGGEKGDSWQGWEEWGEILLWVGGGIGLLLGGWLLFTLIPKGPRVKKSKRIVIESPELEEFRILFEKPLDENNRIALISYKGVNYLVIIGSTNLLLGKYREGEIESREEFERIVEKQDLSKAVESKEEVFTTIEEYRRRAGGDL
ncbi:MAG: hypothetical protein GXO19_01515 [Epsilonproteobacteria bacterium]|nr:hypothetical protein [Campylobacterota bacterium]NPA56393.1 hypothetical protein [Campylobacterota bacterium]